MVVTIHRSAKGWTFAGDGPGVRVRMPAGAEWLEVRGMGRLLFVPTGGRLRVWWSAGRVAEEVEAGRLKLVKVRGKRACAKGGC